MAFENKRWYAMSAEEVAQYYSTDTEYGLAEEEARARLEAHGENEIFKIPHGSFADHLRRLSVNPIVVLLIIVSALGAVLGSAATLAVCTVCTALVYALGIMTYVKSNRILESMAEISIPRVTVIRGGRAVNVDSSLIVPGDIILLRSGQVVPCDGRLVEDEQLVVMEKGIIEHSGNARKNADRYDARVKKPYECDNMVFASTVVLKGRGRAIVTETGKGTLVVQRQKSAIALAYEKFELFDRLTKISHITGVISIALCALISLMTLMLPSVFGALDSLILVLAAASALICECYAVFGYLTVALGVYGTLDTKKKINTGTLIRNVEHLDKLRDITTLAIPLESLCSRQNIKLDRICLYDKIIEADGEEELPEMAKNLLIKAVISTGKYTATRLVTGKVHKAAAYTNEEEAIIKCATEKNLYSVRLDSEYPIVGHVGKRDGAFETTMVKWYGENRIILRGEVAEVLQRCTYYKPNGSNSLLKITPLARKTVETMASQMMRQSHRVIAIASGASKYNSLTRLSELYKDLTLEGIIAFNEPVLPGAAYMISKCREAGIKVALFTRDVSEKNEHFARSVGIIRNSKDLSVAADDYPSVSDEEFVTDIKRCKLFQGFTTPQIRKILRRLGESGERVAYYGRQTADIPVFSEDVIRVTDALTLSPRNHTKAKENTEGEQLASEVEAYRDTTAEALRFGADIIVSPVSSDGKGGFNALVRAICSAKGIYFKIKRIISYLLSVNLARLIYLMLTLFVRSAQLISPVSVLVWGMVLDFLVAFAIAFSADSRDILKNRDKYTKAILSLSDFIGAAVSAVALAASVTVSCLVCSSLTGLNPSQSVSFTLLASMLASLVIYFEGRYKGSSFGKGMSVGSVSLFILALFTAFFLVCFIVKPVGAFLGITALPLWAYIGVILPPAVLFLVIEITKLITRLVTRR